MKFDVNNLIKRVMPQQTPDSTLSQVYQPFKWQTVTKDQVVKLSEEPSYWGAIAALIRLRPELYSSTLEHTMRDSRIASRYLAIVKHYPELSHLVGRPILEIHQGIQNWLCNQPVQEKTASVSKGDAIPYKEWGRLFVKDLQFNVSTELLNHKTWITQTCMWLPKIIVGGCVFGVLGGLFQMMANLKNNEMFALCVLSIVLGAIVLPCCIDIVDSWVYSKIRKDKEIAAHSQAFQKMQVDWHQVESDDYDVQADLWHWLYLSHLRFLLITRPYLSTLEDQLRYDKNSNEFCFNKETVCTRPVDFSQLTPKDAALLVYSAGVANVCWTAIAKKRLALKAPCLQSVETSNIHEYTK